MDAGKVFALLLSALAIGAVVYLQWLSSRSKADTPPQATDSVP